MHVRNLILAASLAVPMMAMPISDNNLVPQENVAVERREFSIARLYRDLFKREPIIEAIPRAASYDTSVEEEEEDKNDEAGIVERRIFSKPGGPKKRVPAKHAGGGPTKRVPAKNPGGGPTKRVATKHAGGGPTKRVPAKNAGGGPTKRVPAKNPGGGPTKRVPTKHAGGGPTKRVPTKHAGGGPTKRFTESLDSQSEQSDIKA